MLRSVKIKLDGKRRLSLGKLVDEHVTGFNATRDPDGRIILEPTLDIPVREVWLYKNRPALASVHKGIEDAQKGATSPLDMALLAEEE